MAYRAAASACVAMRRSAESCLDGLVGGRPPETDRIMGKTWRADSPSRRPAGRDYSYSRKNQEGGPAKRGPAQHHCPFTDRAHGVLRMPKCCCGPLGCRVPVARPRRRWDASWSRGRDRPEPPIYRDGCWAMALTPCRTNRGWRTLGVAGEDRQGSVPAWAPRP